MLLDNLPTFEIQSSEYFTDVNINGWLDTSDSKTAYRQNFSKSKKLYQSEGAQSQYLQGEIGVLTVGLALDVRFWLSPDPAAQFMNPFGHGGDFVNYVDPDGEFVFTAILVGAAIGAVVSGGTYAATAALTNAEWDWGDFGTAVGMGAVGGAISGGVGSLGTSLATNVAYGTLGNVASYTSTSYMFGNGPTVAGYTGAIIGGVVGGTLPGYQAVEGGAFNNIVGEVTASATKGAAVGALTGGIGAAIQSGGKMSAIMDGIGQGAMAGAIGGAVGASVKIAAFGYAQKFTPEQQRQIKNAEEKYGVKLGKYGPVRRSGGLLTSRGVSFARSSVNPTGSDAEGSEEAIHYVQQAKYGPGRFYGQALKEQSQQFYSDFLGGGYDSYDYPSISGVGDSYNPSQYQNNWTQTGFTLEYEANYLRRNGSLPNW